MTTHKHIDKICCIAVIVAMLITVLFMNAETLGIQAADKVMGYEERLFDAEKVHTIDIVIDDWDAFLATCRNEEYSVCSVIIDGEAYKNVGIRGKGNTSLSNVSSMNSNRYSFKIEFDQYDNTKSYYGLDKLCLNNVIQDNTYMKDFLAYQMMNEFGADAPLCSYAYITVNGEDWGLYLAVESVEDGFLQRNYGNNYGELYKPDSMSFGGGRGNGKDFDMGDFDFSQMGGFGVSRQNNKTENNDSSENKDSSAGGSAQNPFGNMFGGEGGFTMPENGQWPDMGNMFGGEMPDMSDMFGGEGGQRPNMGSTPDMSGGMPWGGDSSQGSFPGGTMQMPEGMEFPEGMTFPGMTMPGATEQSKDAENGSSTDSKQNSKDKANSGRDFSNFAGGGMNFGGFGMGSSDVKLQYIDDNASSYSNIFNSAKTDITEADQKRLMESLKMLSSGENIASVVDIDEVIRYFVVHNFVVNGDSYTGSMIHNYYLYEEDGKLSMIPWDYNLAYGTFMGGNASGTVNDPIDSPVSGGTSDRPMIHWIFANEEYTELYHQYFAEFIEQFYTNGKLAELIDYTKELIAPYVEKDPTKFCTYEEFETGVATIRNFCMLRAESVSGQLDGTIPSTSEGQSADSSNLVNTSGLNISAMGTMGGMGGGFGGNRGDRTQGNSRNDRTESGSQSETSRDNKEEPTENNSGEFGNFGNFGSDFSGSDFSEMFSNMFGGEGGFTMPEDGRWPDMGNMQSPEASGNGTSDSNGSSFGGTANSSRPSFGGTGSGMPSFGTSGTSGNASATTIGLLAASVVVMLLGLLVAYKYKR